MEHFVGQHRNTFAEPALLVNPNIFPHQAASLMVEKATYGYSGSQKPTCGYRCLPSDCFFRDYRSGKLVPLCVHTHTHGRLPDEGKDKGDGAYLSAGANNCMVSGQITVSRDQTLRGGALTSPKPLTWAKKHVHYQFKCVLRVAPSSFLSRGVTVLLLC